MIIGVDPGKTVGWAMHDDALPYQAMFQGGEVEFDRFGDWLNVQLQNPLVSLVACEKFIITPATARGAADANWAIEIIGVTRWLAHAWGKTFVMYSAGEAKSFASDANLKKIGWWTTGSDHARMATRQIILALANERGIAPPWVV